MENINEQKHFFYHGVHFDLIFKRIREIKKPTYKIKKGLIESIEKSIKKGKKLEK